MKLMITMLFACLLGLPSGCKTEPTRPTAEQVSAHLATLGDQPTQQEILKVKVKCDKLCDAHGEEAVVDALTQIGENESPLQEHALSLLMQHLNERTYGGMVLEPETKK